MTRRLRETFQHVEGHADFHISSSVLGCKKAARGNDYLVQVSWIGSDNEEETREPTPQVLEDALAVFKELKRLRSRSDKEALIPSAGELYSRTVCFVVLGIKERESVPPEHSFA